MFLGNVVFFILLFLRKSRAPDALQIMGYKII